MASEKEHLTSMGYRLLDQEKYVEKLKKRLNALGWTKLRLSEEAGISRSIIDKTFKHACYMTMRTSYKVYDALFKDRRK